MPDPDVPDPEVDEPVAPVPPTPPDGTEVAAAEGVVADAPVPPPDEAEDRRDGAPGEAEEAPAGPAPEDGEGDDGPEDGAGADAGPETVRATDTDVEAPAPAEEAPPSPAPGLDEVRDEVAGVRAGIDDMAADLAAGAREETVSAGFEGLQRGVDELVRLTRRADEHVAELHSENQRLRAGELASATLPLLRDVVRLHDEVTQLASTSHPDAHGDLDLVRSRLLDTLARWGLTPFAPAVGDALDATRHQGVGRVPSSDGVPGTIATVRRLGFAHDDGRTFRAAEVEVVQAPPPPTDAPAPPPDAPGDDGPEPAAAPPDDPPTPPPAEDT